MINVNNLLTIKIEPNLIMLLFVNAQIWYLGINFVFKKENVVLISIPRFANINNF